MIIHSYLTDGMYDWAVLFLESFRKVNDNIHPIILSTRDLSDWQIHSLTKLYDNIEIRNEHIDYELLSQRTNQKIEDLKIMKRNTEHGNFDLVWKQFISVEDRYKRSIINVIRDYIGSDNSHLMHIDIDMYFRKKTDELFKIIEANDISIHFRSKNDPKYKNENRRVLGSIIGFKLYEKILDFMQAWEKHIDSIPLTIKPIGFGQTSFYRAYLDTKSMYKWGSIPSKFSDPTRSEKSVIWSGNRGEKDSNLRLAKINFNYGIKVPFNILNNKPRKYIKKNLLEIFKKNKNGRFLEIGIGPKVRFERHQQLKKYNIEYYGLDFSQVCDMHESELRNASLHDSRINYLKNDTGTYLFNLVRLRRQNIRFDVIYLDGHHTLYTDMAAALAIVPLLRQGGLLILDDVEFRLSQKEQDLKNSEFYNSIYDFSLYTDEEKNEPHISIILYEYLLPLFNFEILDKFSSSNWVVLQASKRGLLRKLFAKLK